MSNVEAKPSDTILFPISEMDRGIVDLIPKMPTPPRWPAFQAVRHLNRAWKLRDIDPEMAIFRSITAEEEAATALFLSLKRRGYVGSEKIDQRSHIHKNAVIPFFSAITRVVTKVRHQMPRTQLLLDCNNTPPLLKIQLTLPDPLTGQRVFAYPHPPLHFSLLGGPAENDMKTEDFTSGLDEIVETSSVKSIVEYIRTRANQRNQLLYACAEGYPTVSPDGIENALALYQRDVFIILRIYLFIDPYPEKQLFAQQALYAFLKTLKLLPKNFEF
jgi:hypothetical protein